MAEPRTKKTTLACDPCRKRKRKCDGRTPVCSLCEKGNYTCVYDTTLDQRRPAQKNYVAALEARVALLENILKNAGSDDAVGNLNPLTEEEELAPPDAPSTSHAPPPGPEANVSSQLAHDTEHEHQYSFVPADDAANDLESTNLANLEQETDSSDQLDLGMADWIPLISLDAEHKLIAQFWDWQRMHLPYVAPVPFLSAYAIQSEAAHPNEPIPPPPAPPPVNPFSGPTAIGVPRASSVEHTPDLVQFISPLLLDASFAIAALFAGDPETSEKFYRRAETRVLFEAANPRLATLQAMLIMATWELGYARAPATWTLIGVACALCVRLGMNIDATPLVRRGIISKRLFETRNFVFWATYNLDRFSAMCMGMQPLMDKRMISTPRHSSLAAANVMEAPKLSTPNSPPSDSKSGAKAGEDRPTASDTSVTWWDPKTLGMSDIIIQAGWEAIRDLVRMSDMLFDGIFSLNAPKRTPQEDLELVTRNNLTIQRFLDELPTWLRSTGVIRRKENSLVYLHLFTHLTSIIASRPFLSPRPLSEEAMRIDATLDPTQPNHSSHIIRRYRALAFRVARASALQVSSLIRHIALSSPCVTVPYVVYSACTILLLAPDDPAAMDGVRTSIACLEGMDKTGYWVNSAKDAKDRIRVLAERWGVDITPKRKAAERAGGGGGRGGGSGAPGGGPGEEGSGSGGPGAERQPSTEGGQTGPQDTRAGSSSSTIGAQSAPSTSGGTSSNQDSISTPASAALDVSGAASSQPQAYASGSNKQHSVQLHDAGFSDVTMLDQRATGPPSYDDAVTHQAYNPHIQPQVYHSQVFTERPSGAVQPVPTETYVQQQPQAINHAAQYQQHLTYPNQQPAQQPAHHVHYHFHSHVHSHPVQYPHSTAYNTHYQPNRLPHVAYASSHGDPQHDLHLGHNHWHQVLPPTDPNLPFPPDPVACTDIAVCFADTVRTGQDPAFVQNMTDPYADVALDWFKDAQDSFAPIVSQMYGNGGISSITCGPTSVLNPGLYGESSQTGAYENPNASYGDYGGYSGYGMPGL